MAGPSVIISTRRRRVKSGLIGRSIDRSVSGIQRENECKIPDKYAPHVSQHRKMATMWQRRPQTPLMHGRRPYISAGDGITIRSSSLPKAYSESHTPHIHKETTASREFITCAFVFGFCRAACRMLPRWYSDRATVECFMRCNTSVCAVRIRKRFD